MVSPPSAGDKGEIIVRNQKAEQRDLYLAPSAVEIQPSTPEPVREEGHMEEAGNRHFRCLTTGCGRMEKTGKSDWHAYQGGQQLTITCAGCGKTATAKK